jgi:hypothetical protein
MWWLISAWELPVQPELELDDTGQLQACLRLPADGLLAEPLQFSIVAGVDGGMAATPGNRPRAGRAVMLARDLDLPTAGMADAERHLGIAP